MSLDRSSLTAVVSAAGREHLQHGTDMLLTAINILRSLPSPSDVGALKPASEDVHTSRASHDLQFVFSSK